MKGWEYPIQLLCWNIDHLSSKTSIHWRLFFFLPCLITRGYMIYPLVKLPHNYGKSQCLMGKSSMSMAIFNSYVANYQRVVIPKKDRRVAHDYVVATCDSHFCRCWILFKPTWFFPSTQTHPGVCRIVVKQRENMHKRGLTQHVSTLSSELSFFFPAQCSIPQKSDHTSAVVRIRGFFFFFPFFLWVSTSFSNITENITKKVLVFEIQNLS